MMTFEMRDVNSNAENFYGLGYTVTAAECTNCPPPTNDGLPGPSPSNRHMYLSRLSSILRRTFRVLKKKAGNAVGACSCFL